MIVAMSVCHNAVARVAAKPKAAASAPTHIDIPPGSVYPEVTIHEPPIDWRTLKPPALLTEDLKALQTGTQAERIAVLKAKLAHDMVFVEGGEFWMGDFGPYQSKEKLFWSPARHFNKPVQKTRVASFSISKYKVTYAELDLFNEVHKRPIAVPRVGFENRRRPDLPAGADWKDAREYCQWWGELAGQPVDLPIEPQWEYAARNRGSFILQATDTGKFDLNRNVPWDRTMEEFGWEAGVPLPIALYPPTPLGLFDMGTSGTEWMRDPVDLSRVLHADVLKDEIRGPYVTRGYSRVSEGGDEATTIKRAFRKPTTAFEGSTSASYSSNFRCTIHSPKPVVQANPTGATGPGSKPPDAK